MTLHNWFIIHLLLLFYMTRLTRCCLNLPQIPRISEHFSTLLTVKRTIRDDNIRCFKHVQNTNSNEALLGPISSTIGINRLHKVTRPVLHAPVLRPKAGLNASSSSEPCVTLRRTNQTHAHVRTRDTTWILIVFQGIFLYLWSQPNGQHMIYSTLAPPLLFFRSQCIAYSCLCRNAGLYFFSFHRPAQASTLVLLRRAWSIPRAKLAKRPLRDGCDSHEAPRQ
jgi:hypothetical protein